MGCPTGATSTPDGTTFTPVSDAECPTIDPHDTRIEGLLLAKTGPTSNFAAAGAEIKGVEGMTITELGYDIRKGGAPGSSIGSHCGAGAPRFDVVTTDNVDHFVGCDSPPGIPVAASLGWTRLRWTTVELAAAFPPILGSDRIKSLTLIFDEGQDASGGPDSFGLAVLDNIDVNGMLVGRGPNKPEDDDRDEGHGKDTENDDFQFHDSPSRRESSNVSYQDQSQGTKVQSVSGARSVTYNGTGVTLVGDALVNDQPGYLLTFAACDLSALPLGGIGNFSMTVTGPLGFLYQKAAALTFGYVSIHPH